MNGKSYDAELHLVHYKSSYGSFAAAFDAAKPDSLAVIGIFLEEADGIMDSTTIDNLRLAAKELSEGAKTKTKTKTKKKTRFAANQIRNLIQNPLFPQTATMSSPDFPDYPSLGVRASGASVNVDVTLSDFFLEAGFRQVQFVTLKKCIGEKLIFLQQSGHTSLFRGSDYPYLQGICSMAGL